MKSLSKIVVLLVAGLLATPVLAQGDAAAGKQKASQCAACHGKDGNSASAQYPKLAGQGEKYLIKQLHDFKSGKRKNAIMNGMASGLSDQDIQDLAAYFSSQTMSGGTAKKEYVDHGEHVWRGGNDQTQVPACSGCHGPAGQGVEAAGFPRLAGQWAGYIETQLKAFRNAGQDSLSGTKRDNDPNAMMRTVASKMTDKEIRDVASFAAGLSKSQ